MPAATATAVLAHLGEDSALVRLEHPWTLDRHLLVRLVEETNILVRLGLLRGGIKASKLPEPLHIPRPGEKPKAPPPSKGWMRALIEGADIEVTSVG